MESVCFVVYFAAWGVVGVERAADVVVFIYFDAVMSQNLRYGQVPFNVGDLHLKNYLKIFYLSIIFDKIRVLFSFCKQIHISFVNIF